MSTSPTSFKQINPSILQQIAGQTAFGTVKAEMGVAKGSHGEGGGRGGYAFPFTAWILYLRLKCKTSYIIVLDPDLEGV